MRDMFDYIERGGVITPTFREIKPSELTDDTVVYTLQDLIDLLGEERALNLYAHFKTAGATK